MLKKKHFPTVLITVILFSSVYMSNTDINSTIVHNAHGHSFTPDDHALFIASIDQFHAESNLVQASIANNNVTLAQGHADKAANLYFQNLMFEIAEKDQKAAEDLSIAVKSLQNMTISDSPSSASALPEQQQQVNRLVNDIDTKAGEITAMTIRQQEGGLGFLDPVFGAISSIFGDKKDNDNTKLHALRVAELVDMVLRNYGNAYAVSFDMTNMSNMAMMDGNSTMSMSNSSMADDNNSDLRMDQMNNMHSSAMINGGNNMIKNHSPINVAEYQSAQALSAKALEIFNNELKPMTPDNESTVLISNLENGLIQLNHSVRDNASPMDIMMVVHTQIHPNLLEAFNLPLKPGV